MLISQISKLSGRGAGLLAKMLEIAVIFQFIQFKIAASTAIHVKEGLAQTGTAARAEGQTPVSDGQVPITSIIDLAKYTREITVDNVRLLDVAAGTITPQGLANFYNRRIAQFGVVMIEEIQKHLFQGSGAANEMLGLLTFLKDADAAGQTARLGFTAAELADMNVRANLTLDTTANQDALVELLIKNIAKVPGANAVICNETLGARLTMIAKRLGAAGETINDFGTSVQTINGKKIITVPEECMTTTESDGTHADCTSLLIARFAEELGTAVNTNSGLVYTDFDQNSVLAGAKARIEFYGNLAVERADSLRRISRIRMSA